MRWFRHSNCRRRRRRRRVKNYFNRVKRFSPPETTTSRQSLRRINNDFTVLHLPIVVVIA